jgi:hypothetical protein
MLSLRSPQGAGFEVKFENDYSNVTLDFNYDNQLFFLVPMLQRGNADPVAPAASSEI